MFLTNQTVVQCDGNLGLLIWLVWYDFNKLTATGMCFVYLNLLGLLMRFEHIVVYQCYGVKLHRY